MRAERELLPRCCLSANAWRSSAARDCSALSECYEGGLRDRSRRLRAFHEADHHRCIGAFGLQFGGLVHIRLLAEASVPSLLHERAALSRHSCGGELGHAPVENRSISGRSRLQCLRGAQVIALSYDYAADQAGVGTPCVLVSVTM